ncbi:hypothetical protein AGMMS49975_16460 [Clostridia bacterium]|nr:hypothetical protein AGMMS49975_16400 [Clostridia bacterium]GHU55111.1 hypothetical protein AGMMS49975_16460 [Clostridia bacterium]
MTYNTSSELTVVIRAKDLCSYIMTITQKSPKMTQGCILMKQFEQIAQKTTECQRLLGAWINSDKKR